MVACLLDCLRDPRCSSAHKDIVFRLVYMVCKVRGHKALVKRFSHQAMEIFLVMNMLEAQDPKDHEVSNTCRPTFYFLSFAAPAASLVRRPALALVQPLRAPPLALAHRVAAFRHGRAGWLGRAAQAHPAPLPGSSRTVLV
jgi:hypothetical protein